MSTTTYARVVHTCAVPEMLTGLRLVIDAAWTASLTDYWVLTVRERRSGQQFGEKVGESCDLSQRDLAAGEPFTLYDDARGVRLAPGDRVVLYMDRVGTPLSLSDPVVELDLHGLPR